MKLRAREKTIDLSQPVIMGILNVTPDSFSDGGLYLDKEKAIARAEKMCEDGAAIIDVGGESSRPGSRPISAGDEMRRVLPVVKALSRMDVVISVDTYKPRVAEACLEEGAHIINDIYGLRNPELRDVIQSYRAAAVIMHLQGNPQTMQEKPEYKDVVSEVKQFLRKQVATTKKAGIKDVVVDPGVGFGKTLEHNLALLNQLETFCFGPPLLVGVSRKSFIGKLTGAKVDERLPGTLAVVTLCIANGANILRVHDVAECKQASQVAWAIKNG